MTRLCFSFKFKIQVRFGSKEALIVKTAEKAIPKIPPRVPDNTPNHLIPSTNNPLPSTTPSESFASSIQTPTPPSSDTHPKITPPSFGTLSFEPWKENVERKVGYDETVAKMKALTTAIKQPLPSFEKHHLNLWKTGSENALMIVPFPKENPLVPYIVNTPILPIEKFVHGGNPTGNLLLQKMIPTFPKENLSNFKDIFNKFEILLQESKKNDYSHMTAISATTKINDIPLEQLLLEAYVRKIIKVDKGHTACTLITENDTTLKIGEQPYGVKTTPLFDALSKQIAKVTTTPINPINNKFFSDPQHFLLLAITKKSTDFVVSRGAELHINLAQKNKQVGVFDSTTNTYKIIGYLTSQKTGKLFSSKQFKKYQQEHYGPSNVNAVITKEKEQYFVEYENIREISCTEVLILKGGADYIRTCGAKMMIEDLAQDGNKKNIITFESQNATVESLLMACQKYDQNIKEKKPQPLTDIQIQQNENNKIKMKQKESQQITPTTTNTSINAQPTENNTIYP